MKFLPYEKFIIKTRMKPEDVYNEFEKSMMPSEETGERIFRGKLNQDYFKITPWFILYYNGYMPVLRGKISSHEAGALIAVTIRPDLFQISFLILFSVFILSGFANELATIVKSGQTSYEGLGTLLMFLFFEVLLYILAMISFKPNILKYKKLVIETLESEEVIELGLFETPKYERHS